MEDNMNEEVICALNNVARALRELGKEDAAIPMGAIEVLANEITECSQRIAEGLHHIAESISSER